MYLTFSNSQYDELKYVIREFNSCSDQDHSDMYDILSRALPFDRNMYIDITDEECKDLVFVIKWFLDHIEWDDAYTTLQCTYSLLVEKSG